MAFDLKDFEKDVIARSADVPVVVDFWAPWCGPCKMLGPVIEKMAEKADGKWELVKVNTEDHPKVALDWEIAGIPDVRMFRDGKCIADFKGFLPEEQIADWLHKHLPSVNEDRIEQARELAVQGELTRALKLAEGVLKDEPGNEGLRITAAEWALRVAPAKAVELVCSVTEDSDIHEQAAAIGIIAEFLQVADTTLNGAEEAKRDAFESGLIAQRKGDTEAWVDAWLEVIERQKDFADGKLVDTCKALFRFLGPRHPVSDKFYRRFTSALY
ncbi:MAG: thioredoxin [Verrucomicrobiales bacterium]|nr:thioredoxin [Verrucomicrobiales bacterium]